MEKKNQHNKGQQLRLYDPFLFFALIILAFWILGWVLIDFYIPDVSERGLFGDKFGSINTLFSGLALAGIISTMLLQKEGLRIQHSEFEEMLKVQRIQSFENSLFNMLSLQQEIVGNLSFVEDANLHQYAKEKLKIKSKSAYSGRDVFEPLFYRLLIQIDGVLFIGIHNAIKAKGVEIYDRIYNTTCLDHYFRHLYRIFKFIDDNPFLINEEKYNYACIIRSQLSDYELVMLFYNCLSMNGFEKFKPLIEKYAVFNNLRVELLANACDKDLYSDSAYNYVYRCSNKVV